MERELTEHDPGETIGQKLAVGTYDGDVDGYHAVAADGTTYIIDREAFEQAAEEAAVTEHDGETWNAFLASWHTGLEGVPRA